MIKPLDKACIASPAEGEVTTGEADLLRRIDVWLDVDPASRSEFHKFLLVCRANIAANAGLRAKLDDVRALMRSGYRPMLAGRGRSSWYENSGDATQYKTADDAIDAALAKRAAK